MEEELRVDTKQWPPSYVLETICRLKDKGYYFDDENISMNDVDTIHGRLWKYIRFISKSFLNLMR